ncbi:MAG: 16S rRNA (uracil(1498)-N(3))-methyltransferase [Planctomycetota bacterium]
MNARFYCPNPTESTATLADSEAHHLLHVLRAKVGERVTLFDGIGHEYEAEVTKLGRREVELAVLNKQPISRESKCKLTLAVALPKGDRQKFLVEKAVELGVARIVPVVTEFSGSAPKGSAIEKLRRAVIEASKQCRRNHLMQIDDPVTWGEFIEIDTQGTKWILHPYNSEPAVMPADADGVDVTCLIGPEGGFSESELEKAVACGWQAVELGPRILRIETAAVAIAAKWLL